MGTSVDQPKAAGLPAHLQALVGDTTVYDEYSGGIQSGFPVVSYRGKVWRLKSGGEENMFLDKDTEEPQASIEAILVRSNPNPSKIHYDKQYAEGDDSKPRCWSDNGIEPSDDVENPINSQCGNCPMNQWGSRITEAGKKSRACSDTRRTAVVFAHELEDHIANSADLPISLLRIPPASLNPLKDYVEKVLKPKGIPPFVMVTRLGFDPEAAFPKITFKPARFLTEDETAKILELRDGDEVRRILNDSSAEYTPEGTTSGGDEPGAAATATDEAPKSPSGASKKKRTRKKAKKKTTATPAEAEATAAEATTVVEPDEPEDPMAALMGTTEPETEQEPETPAAPVAATEPEEPDDDPEETTEPAGDDFDAMLDKLLGDD